MSRCSFTRPQCYARMLTGECTCNRAKAIPSLLAAIRPFVNVKDQCPQAIKLIDRKLDGFAPITVTVTKAQFLAALDAIKQADG